MNDEDIFIVTKEDLNKIGELWIAEVCEIFYRNKNGKSLGEFFEYYDNVSKSELKFSEVDMRMSHKIKMYFELLILPIRSWYQDLEFFIWKHKK